VENLSGCLGAATVTASWVTRILPYIEQQAVFDRYNFDRQWDHKGTNDADGGPIKTHINGFLCPSAPAKNLRLQKEGRGCFDYPATTERESPNAFLNAHVASAVKDSDPYYIGVLGHNKVTGNILDPCRRRFANITDGTSNTFLIAECAGRNQNWHMGIRQSAVMTRGPWSNPDTRIKMGGCDPKNPTAARGPRAVNCNNDKEIFAFHPGGAMACMADASVRLVSTNLDLNIAYSLLTRERGEQVPTDF
jgi:hypothetical protein